jgi:hypothetical protein
MSPVFPPFFPVPVFFLSRFSRLGNHWGACSHSSLLRLMCLDCRSDAIKESPRIP